MSYLLAQKDWEEGLKKGNNDYVCPYTFQIIETRSMNSKVRGEFTKHAFPASKIFKKLKNQENQEKKDEKVFEHPHSENFKSALKFLATYHPDPEHTANIQFELNQFNRLSSYKFFATKLFSRGVLPCLSHKEASGGNEEEEEKEKKPCFRFFHDDKILFEIYQRNKAFVKRWNKFTSIFSFYNQKFEDRAEEVKKDLKAFFAKNLKIDKNQGTPEINKYLKQLRKDINKKVELHVSSN